MQAEAAAEESAKEDELKEARKEAAGLIEAARQEADEYRTAERARIDEEIVGLREQAQTDVDASKQQALSELRGEVASLAIGAAEEVLGQNLDQEANEALVESFIDRVGADNG
jgi:F-type H+-transporting ATPase subunit b